MAMSSAGGIGRARQRLRALSDRTPLRIKMITAVLALVIIALGVISLTRSGVRSGRARSHCQARPSLPADDMAIRRLRRREPQYVPDAAQRVQ